MKMIFQLAVEQSPLILTAVFAFSCKEEKL